MAGAPRIAEITLCAAWHAGEIPARLETVDGQAMEVVHRGSWTHGLGPDFRDALILLDGRELRAGSVEVHLRTRGWTDHGHHLDPAYDTVILHVVGQHDGSQTRRQDGAIVPVVDIGPVERFAVPALAAWDWQRVGGRACAERLATDHRTALRALLFQLGDVRLAARSARLEARLPSEPPGEILWSELLDGLGFTANRQPMRALARAVPLATLENLLQTADQASRRDLARGILLGAAGFLPLSPADAHAGSLDPASMAALEHVWFERGGAWQAETLPPTAWDRVRVRPANHPVPRLLAAANMAAAASSAGGLLSAVLGTLEGEDAVADLQALASDDAKPRIGVDRARDILASGVMPFALAFAAHTGDQVLADAASGLWERLPASAANAVTRRAHRQVAGAAPLGQIGARGAQGLIHLDTALCQPRRCFECPIAAGELALD